MSYENFQLQVGDIVQYRDERYRLVTTHRFVGPGGGMPRNDYYTSIRFRQTKLTDLDVINVYRFQYSEEIIRDLTESYPETQSRLLERHRRFFEQLLQKIYNNENVQHVYPFPKPSLSIF